MSTEQPQQTAQPAAFQITDVEPRDLIAADSRPLREAVYARRVTPQPATVMKSEALLAEALAGAAGCKLRRDRGRDVWKSWDGGRWVDDPDAPAVAYDALISRHMSGSPAVRQRKVMAYSMKKLAKADRDMLILGGDRETTHAPVAEDEWAESTRVQTAVIRQMGTREGIAVPSDAWDADPLLIAAGDSYIRLDAGTWSAPDPSALVTKRLGTIWDTEATCPLWERFMADVIPDPSVRDYVQRAVGMSLLGEVREARLFCLTGVGANGKSIFIETISALFGEYAASLEPKVVMSRQQEGHSTDLMPLLGARFAVVPEVPMGRAWDSETIKRLTGGDTLSARWIGENTTTWRPSHTMWVSTNGTPSVPPGSAAFWRRYREVPFVARFASSADEMPGATGVADPQLGGKLMAELPGILQWAVRGYAAYAQFGLADPPAVLEASAEAARMSNPWAAFCREALELDGTSSVTVQTIWKAWQEFREQETDFQHSRPTSARMVPSLLSGELPAVRCTKSTGGKSPATALGVRLSESGQQLLDNAARRTPYGALAAVAAWK